MATLEERKAKRREQKKLYKREERARENAEKAKTHARILHLRANYSKKRPRADDDDAEDAGGALPAPDSETDAGAAGEPRSLLVRPVVAAPVVQSPPRPLRSRRLLAAAGCAVEAAAVDKGESRADEGVFVPANKWPWEGQMCKFFVAPEDDRTTGGWYLGSCVRNGRKVCVFDYTASRFKMWVHKMYKKDEKVESVVRIHVRGTTGDCAHVGPLTARVARAARATYDEPPADVASDEFFTRVLDLGLPGRLLDAVLLIGTLLTAPLWRMRFFAHLGHWRAGGMELECAAIQRALRTIESTWEAEAYLLPPKPGHIANYRWPKKVCGRFLLDEDALANLQTVLLRGIDFAGALARLKARAVAGDAAAGMPFEVLADKVAGEIVKGLLHSLTGMGLVVKYDGEDKPFLPNGYPSAWCVTRVLYGCGVRFKVCAETSWDDMFDVFGTLVGSRQRTKLLHCLKVEYQNGPFIFMKENDIEDVPAIFVAMGACLKKVGQ